MKEPKRKNVLKVKQTAEVVVLTLSRSIACQFDKEYGRNICPDEWKEALDDGVIGWVWSSQINWTTGQAKALLVRFGNGDYRWVCYNPGMILSEPPQIVITGR